MMEKMTIKQNKDNDLKYLQSLEKTEEQMIITGKGNNYPISESGESDEALEYFTE